MRVLGSRGHSAASSRLHRVPAAARLAFAGLAFALGCKESPAVGQIQAFEAALCACKDLSCAEAERAKVVAWHRENRSTLVSDSEQAAITESTTRARTCLEALAPPPAAVGVAPVAPDAAPAAGVVPAAAEPAAAEAAPAGAAVAPESDPPPIAPRPPEE